ncbi:hypothetical protein [Acetivibrio mesophilus]|uniref:Uncharacterized protein n=1 Tax=Acetivibrio mesophilus TaxID=2487273 RepID=A0A4Q0I062_9FIRM|nr:hypothetical protein [Acetivibrio mesophilus]ODM24817.1 hypothetical protein A7W90_00505 [Clostridium sp. Bc-iso-3]RXE57586.1 hypothetical protein EFD62_16905 [Acetivibrio mesophilus]
MDKHINRLVPFKFDLKNSGYGIYFLVLSMVLAFVYNLVITSGAWNKYITLQVSIFLISVVGVLVWILPGYLEIVNPESKELILALPIKGYTFVFLRVLRLYTVYVIFILGILSIISNMSDEKMINFGVLQGFLIAGALYFLSGLGLVSLFITKHGVIGYCFPILWTMVSFFYRGGGLWFLHPCEWIVPKPYDVTMNITIALWVFGIILHIAATIIVNRREYLIN